MIRGAIARHAGAGRSFDSIDHVPTAPARSRPDHGSHAIFAIASTGEGDCIIEPSVRCDHCGYCKSLGH